MADNIEPVAELICELTRNCNIKEEYFASSFNLSPTEVRFLKLLAIKPTYSIKELRDILKLTPGRITHILTSLEDKKLISRTLDPTDKRVTIVSLMPKAGPLISNLQQNYRELHNRILKSVKEEEMEKILSSLEILVDVFKKWVNQK
ncbi:MarR family transcriptional regulator [Ignavibacterium album JCM 16511]|uniref:MarR family transcriptional regulator n=1 Tax=Ignavibacterium album (strain DSM 19864 / JCM 16511 / NBRC 101810 / Mat9-16) TaxID=945713 RepID=I0AIJ6_IGNAJ|nr:MarR family transcriptional regulator [Ignavibacterium album]AFH48803.1 MarR family transcriptional regulator [Ignavibacterium album JCM 16511]